MGSSFWAGAEWENVLFSSGLKIGVLEGEELDKLEPNISLAVLELEMTSDLRKLYIIVVKEIEVGVIWKLWWYLVQFPSF